MRGRVFLLSPANAGGERAKLVLGDRAQFDLAVKLRREGAPLCEVFAFIARPLIEVFGERLLFPAEFVGRGDMSRGGLMLRCARAEVELNYVPVPGAARHGPRPPRLPKWTRDDVPTE